MFSFFIIIFILIFVLLLLCIYSYLINISIYGYVFFEILLFISCLFFLGKKNYYTRALKIKKRRMSVVFLISLFFFPNVDVHARELPSLNIFIPEHVRCVFTTFKLIGAELEKDNAPILAAEDLTAGSVSKKIVIEIANKIKKVEEILDSPKKSFDFVKSSVGDLVNYGKNFITGEATKKVSFSFLLSLILLLLNSRVIIKKKIGLAISS